MFFQHIKNYSIHLFHMDMFAIMHLEFLLSFQMIYYIYQLIGIYVVL